MILRRSATQLGAGRHGGGWPVFALILVAVLVPTACVLWFMAAAMENERLAVRQRLTDVYRSELIKAQKNLNEYWSARLRQLQDANALPPAEAFRKLVVEQGFDSVVIYDANGGLAYPIVSVPTPETDPNRPAEIERAWVGAREMERAGDANAAGAYARIAATEENVDFKARALQAQARSLLRAGQNEPAAALLAGELAKDEYRAARDESGRLIAPDALLAALHVTPAEDANSRETIARDLLARLVDYSGPAMPSAQRMFLMTELRSQTGLAGPTLEAERLAALYAEEHAMAPATAGLARAGVADWWEMPSPNRRSVALIAEQAARSVIENPGSPPDSLVAASLVLHYWREEAASEPFLSSPAGRHMPDWHIALYLNDSDPFAAAAEQRNAAYLWTGILGIAFIAVMAAALASYLGRQMRLTRLKSDLIDTVSHELKTPLASMRVLVDTLRDGRCADGKQAGEYYDLIARENHRLSRLIENFLTFSRMERNKRAFDFAAVDVGEAIRAATEAVSERFSAPGATLTVDVAPDLPPVRADRDALETVVLNLLDNAWKYSGQDKAVTVRVSAEGAGAVLIAVSDNGIGISRRAQRRIFGRFYQVDQTLSRRGGGCGLGLAIVKFILDAHGGTISVKSQPGKGSVFTVRLSATKGMDHGAAEMQRRETAEGECTD